MEKVVIGNAELYCGDCLEVLSVLPKVDAVITDPPYNEVNRESGGLRNLDRKGADSLPVDCSRLAPLLAAVSTGCVYIFCGTEQVSELRRGLVNAGMTTRQCVWEKTNPSPMNGQHVWLSGVELCVYGKHSGGYHNAHCKVPVWRYPTEPKEFHPTAKPLPLIERLVFTSVPAGGTVLDAYMGSGTTGIACMNLERKFIGVEINRKYFDIACERIERAQQQYKLAL